MISLSVCAQIAGAQTLTWGVNGAGGSGNWDATTANWFNGAQNVHWADGGDAVFAGASGGTVNSYSGGPIVHSITFNTPGYSIQNGSIQTGNLGFTITTNADAAISSSLNKSSSTSGNILNKSGPAALVFSGNISLSAVNIIQGEFRVATSSLLSTEVDLVNAASATLTLAPTIGSTVHVQTLNGGGNSGGVVQPNNQARTVVLQTAAGNFSGILQDNGSGILGLDLDGNSGELTLTNANTYSGPTTIVDGTVVFAGNGSALNSLISVAANGTLLLDNRSAVLNNRVSDSAVVALTGGKIQMQGNAATPIEEFAGPLNITGTPIINVTQPGAAATQLTFSALQRIGHATLNIQGPGVKFGGLSNDPTGIVAPYITDGADWAMEGSDGRIAPFSAYATDINAAATSDHVKLSGGGSTALAADAVRGSLYLQSNGPSNQVLDLSGRNLTLTGGGILSTGARTSTIHGGTLSTSSQEIVITASNSLTIDSQIVDAGGSTTLTKSGTGVVTLTGANSYSGPTAIIQGTLVASSDANLGTGSSIDLSGGTLKAAGSFTSTKGFTVSSGTHGTIDTGGFNVSFSGAGANLVKNGLGTLTLATASPGHVSVDAGLLVLPNATSGDVDLFGGNLQVTGTLSSLSCDAGLAVLDLGGSAAARVTTGFFFGSFSTLQINFGIGAAGSDFFAITGEPVSFSSRDPFQFEFANLGGVRTGVDYPLMSFSAFSSPSPSIFSFAPDMAAAGWTGTFKTTTTGVSVRFTSVPVPEPGATLLLLQVAVIVLAAHRRLFVPRSAV